MSDVKERLRQLDVNAGGNTNYADALAYIEKLEGENRHLKQTIKTLRINETRLRHSIEPIEKI